MISNKTYTIFPNKQVIPSELNENEKLSYWLEKLHIQGELIREDNNRRENNFLVHTNEQSSSEQIITNKNQEISQSGINEYRKNTAAQKEKEIHIVNDLVKKSNRSIIRISAGGLLNLFPDTIDVEESRVIFKFNQFLSSQSHSVDIKDISNVFIETSLFFSTLQVVSRTYIQNDIKIGNLNKKKAKSVQHIIEGLRTFDKYNINTSNYEIEELVAKIAEFHTH